MNWFLAFACAVIGGGLHKMSKFVFPMHPISAWFTFIYVLFYMLSNFAFVGMVYFILRALGWL